MQGSVKMILEHMDRDFCIGFCEYMVDHKEDIQAEHCSENWMPLSNWLGGDVKKETGNS
ncbi:MAG: hypothetical protein ACOYCB_10865 [Fastidiosipilaceae bacterium]|jgi:hypothetical protein